MSLRSLLDGTTANIMIVENSLNGPAELILTPRRGEPTPPNPSAVAFSDDADPARDLPRQSQQPQQSQPYNNQPSPRPGTVLTGPPDVVGLPLSNGGQTGAPVDGGANLGTTPGAFIPAGQTPPDYTAQPTAVSAGTPAGTPTDAAPAAAAAAPDASEPASPNGVSTPQQIYEQLMRLRKQQQTTTNPQ